MSPGRTQARGSLAKGRAGGQFDVARANAHVAVVVFVDAHAFAPGRL